MKVVHVKTGAFTCSAPLVTTHWPGSFTEHEGTASLIISLAIDPAGMDLLAHCCLVHGARAWHVRRCWYLPALLFWK